MYRLINRIQALETEIKNYRGNFNSLPSEPSLEFRVEIEAVAHGSVECNEECVLLRSLSSEVITNKRLFATRGELNFAKFESERSEMTCVIYLPPQLSPDTVKNFYEHFKPLYLDMWTQRRHKPEPISFSINDAGDKIIIKMGFNKRGLDVIDLAKQARSDIITNLQSLVDNVLYVYHEWDKPASVLNTSWEDFNAHSNDVQQVRHIAKFDVSFTALSDTAVKLRAAKIFAWKANKDFETAVSTYAKGLDSEEDL
jgi:hypothetical protein